MEKNMKMEEKNMNNLIRNIGNEMNGKALKFKEIVMKKQNGDGHYVAIAIGLLLSIAIGGIIWALVGGNTGLIHTWLTSITQKVTDFISNITA